MDTSKSLLCGWIAALRGVRASARSALLTPARTVVAIFCCFVSLAIWAQPASDQPAYPPVLAGKTLSFPADTGAHPDYRTEWWYITGWLRDPAGVERGFQVTFFRVRTLLGEDNPSRFAPSQLIIAHAALADPGKGRLLHDERAARAVAPLAGAATGQTHVWMDDWSLKLEAGGDYSTQISAASFDLALRFRPTTDVVLNGDEGWSQKAPDPRHASFYYSRPQLTVSGTLELDGATLEVSGHAWLDHEWSSEILPEDASGWDWIGINLHDGGSLMAFQMRDHQHAPIWHAGTLVEPGQTDTIFGPDDIRFEALDWWVSPRSGVRYPVVWMFHVGSRRFRIEPLMHDQELDSRQSTGAIYWEGAVRLLENDKEVGQGYLEMTGYGARLRM